MRMRTICYFSYEEIKCKLNYRLIVESVGSSRWNTGSNKRKLEEEFSSEDLDTIKSLYKKALFWYNYGVPEEIALDYNEYEVWKRLKEYCIKNFTIYGGNV